MSNIALISYDADENGGGVQRVSALLAKNLAKRGFLPFLIYEEKLTPPSDFYAGKFEYTELNDNDQLKLFLKENGVKIVINNCVSPAIHTGKEIREVLDECGCRLVSIIHAKPDLIKVTPSVRSLWWNARFLPGMAAKVSSVAKIIGFPLYKQASNRRYIAWRRGIYEASDKVVVLARPYIDCFCNLLGVANTDSKVLAIPNPLNFDYKCTEEDMAAKCNEVLVVSRLEESAKGLSRVFKMWRNICRAGLADNWELTVVGSGKDGEYYKRLCRRLKLKNVVFEGHQRPFDYYRRAKIFLMSSYHEGFPMTVLEAEQMGLAIMAFNDFESLQELVDEGVNGFLANGIDDFSDKLLKLMEDEALLKQMGLNSIRHSARFSREVVIGRWESLLKELEK